MLHTRRLDVKSGFRTPGLQIHGIAAAQPAVCFCLVLGAVLTLTIDAPQGLICISEPGRPAAAVDVIRETFSDDCSACEVVPEGG